MSKREDRRPEHRTPESSQVKIKFDVSRQDKLKLLEEKIAGLQSQLAKLDRERVADRLKIAALEYRIALLNGLIVGDGECNVTRIEERFKDRAVESRPFELSVFALALGEIRNWIISNATVDIELDDAPGDGLQDLDLI